jgi:hypothetical protein
MGPGKIAMENAKISRPQPISLDKGAMNKPNPERTPKVSREIKQPAIMTTAGVPQAFRAALAVIFASLITVARGDA